MPAPAWDRTPFTLYVPAPGAAWAALLARGAAIVSDSPARDGHRLVDVGGGQDSRDRSLVQPALIAADRHASRAPTSARYRLPDPDLIPVGVLDYIFGRIEVTDPAALTAWLGRPPRDADLAADGIYADLRLVESWPVEQRAALRRLPAAARARYERAGLL